MKKNSLIQIVCLVEGKTKAAKIDISDLRYQQLISQISENYDLPSDSIYHFYYLNTLNQTITVSSKEDLTISFTQNINFKYYLQEVQEPQFHWLKHKQVTSQQYQFVSQQYQLDTYIEEQIQQKKKVLANQMQQFKQRTKQRVVEKIRNNIISIKQKYISQNNDAIHRGIYCNDCNRQIKGDRYRCLVCQQYNLCSKCEFFNSVHDDNHPFIKIQDGTKDDFLQRQSLVNSELETKFVEFTSSSLQTYCKLKKQYPKATESQLIEHYFARQ